MFNLMIYMLIFMMFSLLILNISMLTSKKMKFNLEKMSSFECGFDMISKSRFPFSVHFFLITIIFLIFDVELALLMPMIKTYKYSIKFIWMTTNLLLILILLLGILHEWYQNMLSWTK